MGFFDYFKTKRALKEFESVLVSVIEEQDAIKNELVSLRGTCNGLKFQSKLLRERIGVEPVNICSESDNLSDVDEFVKVHGMTPKQFADQKIRQGVWV